MLYHVMSMLLLLQQYFDATFHIGLRAAYALSVCLLFESFFCWYFCSFGLLNDMYVRSALNYFLLLLLFFQAMPVIPIYECETSKTILGHMCQRCCYC